MNKATRPEIAASVKQSTPAPDRRSKSTRGAATIEQMYLGLVLRGAPCPDFLGEQHFVDQVHGTIYATMESFKSRDVGMLKAYFERSGEIKAVGTSYLDDLMATAVDLPLTAAMGFARAVHDLWVERLLTGLLAPPADPMGGLPASPSGAVH
ncbi:DnaB-like helicase N-terminal domain-containing protein [Roseococcus sp. YIM B11640]|uniref:DnaB-like helicase N-terminal domain-containing protein n=1 Tax=Roseococcus sp. YIM B11640 TaxID=3133973 RepID=UPI003C7DB8F9